MRISIITITYNSEKTIERAIKSVINQDFPDKEYIIIDGGSTDNTLNIIEKYKDKIDYFISEKDKGISDAFNKGISAATGDYIGILNSDDELYPNVLSQIAPYCRGNVDVLRGTQISYNTATGEECVLEPTKNFNKVPFRFHVCHMATYISKNAFEKYGNYRLDFRIAMDLELLYRMHNKGASIKYMDVCVGKFYTGGISTTDLKRKRQEVAMVYTLNGANPVQAYMFKLLLSVKDFVKHVI